MDRFRQYGPVIVSTLVFVVLALREVIQDGGISLEDRYVLAIAAVNAVVTFVVPNLTGTIARHAKTITNAALVGLAFFVKAQTGDGESSTTEIIDGVVLVLGTLGVLITVGPRWHAPVATVPSSH
jgi:hypothetical protein